MKMSGDMAPTSKSIAKATDVLAFREGTIGAADESGRNQPESA